MNAAPQATEEIRGTIKSQASVKYHKDSFFIGRLTVESGREVSVKGTLVQPMFGSEYVFKGRWEDSDKFGRTFKFVEYTVTMPTTKDGIVTYLVTTAKWLGHTTAWRIVDAYGEQALEVLKNDPERVAEQIKGLSLARATDIQGMLKANEEREATEIALRSILGPAGVNQRQFQRIVDTYGLKAPEVVRANPYRLIEDIQGVGWETADRVAEVLEIEPAHPGRVRAAILHALNESEDKDGNTCTPIERLKRDAYNLLRSKVPTETIESYIAIMLDPPPATKTGRDLAIYGVAGAPCQDVYRIQMWDAENGVAGAIRMLLTDEDPEKLIEEERARRRGDEALDALDGLLDALEVDAATPAGFTCDNCNEFYEGEPFEKVSEFSYCCQECADEGVLF